MKKRTTIYADKENYDVIKKASEKLGLSINAFFRMSAIREAKKVNEEEKGENKNE